MEREFDREALRERLRKLSDVERRIVLERVAEQLTDATLESLFDALVPLDLRPADAPAPPSLSERVEAHVAATRHGAFRGELVLRNEHGQREPWETVAWVAATSHLFDATLGRIRDPADEVSLASLRSLVELVTEVDERTEELVVFEDSCARDHFWSDLASARRILERPNVDPRGY